MVVGSLFFGGDDFSFNTGLINGANQKNRFVFYPMIGAWALHLEFAFLVSKIWSFQMLLTVLHHFSYVL